MIVKPVLFLLTTGFLGFFIINSLIQKFSRSKTVDPTLDNNFSICFLFFRGGMVLAIILSKCVVMKFLYIFPVLQFVFFLLAFYIKFQGTYFRSQLILGFHEPFYFYTILSAMIGLCLGFSYVYSIISTFDDKRIPQQYKDICISILSVFYSISIFISSMVGYSVNEFIEQ